MNMKSQEFAQHIERMKSVFNNSEGVTLKDYKKWTTMLDMFLKLKIEMENFEINTQLNEQAEIFKEKEVSESINRFNLASAVQGVVKQTREDIARIADPLNDALKQHDLQVQNDCGLTEEQEFISSIDESDETFNKEEMEDRDEQ